MTVQPRTTARPTPKQRTTTPTVGFPTPPQPDSPVLADVLRRLTGGSARYVACAPGRLDIMGGIAEYSGGLVLNTTILEHVCAGAQLREDGNLTIIHAQAGNASNSVAIALPLERLYSGDGDPITAQDGAGLLKTDAGLAARCALGVVVELLRCGQKFSRGDGGGLSIALGSTLHDLTDVATGAATAAATLSAVVAALEIEVKPRQAAELCQRIENDWLGIPVGIGGAASALMGEPGALMQVRCDPWSVSSVSWPQDDIVLMGIDTGVVLNGAAEKYERVRVATFMGRMLIDRIIRHDGVNQQHWDGYLSRLSVTDFAKCMRDRIPTKMAGREFLDHFGETGDPLTQIEPDTTYKIRSRTEHHIYEHARACQFADCFSRAVRNGNARALKDAGELMFASHWSYGQRCGLGSVETDRLITLIRRQDAGGDIFGAKITGRGCGGVVAVLMRNSDRAHGALQTALKAYTEQTSKTPRQITGSHPGAFVSGARRIDNGR